MVVREQCEKTPEVQKCCPGYLVVCDKEIKRQDNIFLKRLPGFDINAVTVMNDGLNVYPNRSLKPKERQRLKDAGYEYWGGSCGWHHINDSIIYAIKEILEDYDYIKPSTIHEDYLTTIIEHIKFLFND